VGKGKWHGGKGSTYRNTDSDAYAKNWERIFNDVKRPKYKNKGEVVETPEGGSQSQEQENPKTGK
jgi:hypothetical protein